MTRDGGSRTARGGARCCWCSVSFRSRGSRFSGSSACCASASARRRTGSSRRVFLGSGLLFVGMLFVAAAVSAGLVASAGQNRDSLVTSGAWAAGRHTAYELMNVYAMRMAAVFTLATSTILLRTGLAPRWLVVSGYAVAILLLLTVGFFAWIELIFPGSHGPERVRARRRARARPGRRFGCDLTSPPVCGGRSREETTWAEALASAMIVANPRMRGDHGRRNELRTDRLRDRRALRQASGATSV